MKKAVQIPTLTESLAQLCGSAKIQSGQHIKPVNNYCSTRLVLEGGFPPEWVLPRPPLCSKRINNRLHNLVYDENTASTSERSVLGGIKFKRVDLTAVVPNIGPALAISTKSTGNAFRNLTNRMEETLGECTNIHLMYPGIVLGFFHLIKFVRVNDADDIHDASFDNKDEPLSAIRNYHDVLVSISRRNAITDPGWRYEAVALLIYQCRDGQASIWDKYPPIESPVHFSMFFKRLYDLYDVRYVYPDPDGPSARKEWKTEKKEIPSRFDSKTPFAWELRLP